MKNVLRPLAKSFLMSSGLTAAALTVDAKIYKKNPRLGDYINNNIK